MTDQDHTEPAGSPGTTHAGWGEGNPHLIVSGEAERFTVALTVTNTRIGSAPDNEIVLAGTDPIHAIVEHDDRDEYVLTLVGEGEMNANPESAATAPGDHSETLRTGAQFTAGPWRLVFGRAEFADHGRPFGGRQGGELSDQEPQPSRPDYTGDHAKAAPHLEAQD